MKSLHYVHVAMALTELALQADTWIRTARENYREYVNCDNSRVSIFGNK